MMKDFSLAGKNSSLYDIVLVLVLIVFILLKLPTLYTPYFWDELGVYVPGALSMVDEKTIGLLPSNLDPEYSRGHPLLFYFLTALFYQGFGDSVFVGHAFAILVAVITLLVVYRFIRTITDKRSALVTVILLVAQPVFFAMSGVLFPEMLFTLLAVIAFWGIVTENSLLYVVGASLAVLTKEPGLILVAAAGTFSLMKSFKAKDFFTAKRWFNFFCIAIPALVFGLFLLIQRQQNGWFFFPYHVELMHVTSSVVWGTMKQFVRELVLEQGRWVISLGFLVMLVIARFRIRDEKYRMLLRAFLIVLLWAIIFAGFNYYLSRYMLWVYPIYIGVLVIGIFVLVKQHFSVPGVRKVVWGTFFSIAVLFAIVKTSMTKNGIFNDTYDLSYLQNVACVQQCVSWIEQQPWSHSKFRVNFPVFQALSDERNGYLSRTPLPFTTNMDDFTEYIVYFTLTGAELPMSFKSCKVTKQFNNGHSHITVYQVVDKQ